MSNQPALQWPAEGNARVPYRVFSDPEIYREELARIFLGPTWQFLTLAGELPEPGDYLTTFLGETPVIVTRGHDGEIHAMVNRCAHRGNLVCLKRRGHADNLTCVYHAWRYDLEGNLDSVAFRRGVAGKGGMPESFRLDQHGLKKLRVDQLWRSRLRHLVARCAAAGRLHRQSDRLAHSPGHARQAEDPGHHLADPAQQLEALFRKRARHLSRDFAAHAFSRPSACRA